MNDIKSVKKWANFIKKHNLLSIKFSETGEVLEILAKSGIAPEIKAANKKNAPPTLVTPDEAKGENMPSDSEMMMWSTSAFDLMRESRKP